ncbi:MAG: DUF1292 domain-containing protein [Bacillota bacterium]
MSFDSIEDEVIVLTDEDGREEQFILLDMIEVDGATYAILKPLDEGTFDEESEESEFDDDVEEVFVYRVEIDEAGEQQYVEIEDDEEFEKVAEAWESLQEEEFEDEEE